MRFFSGKRESVVREQRQYSFMNQNDRVRWRRNTIAMEHARALLVKSESISLFPVCACVRVRSPTSGFYTRSLYTSVSEGSRLRAVETSRCAPAAKCFCACSGIKQ